MSTVTILVAAFAIFAGLMLVWAYHNRKAEEERRGWRIRCVVAGRWAYEEKKDGGWVGITLEELGDYRESPHIVGLPSADAWRSLPTWAAERRDEIVSRVKSELKSPHYVLKEA